MPPPCRSRSAWASPPAPPCPGSWRAGRGTPAAVPGTAKRGAGPLPKQCPCSPSPSAAPCRRRGGPERFLPLAPSGCVSAELAQLLNQSLRSQPGFQPLEPQLDDSAGPGLSLHPPHLAEHPYLEDEGGPSDGETPPNSSLESGGQVPPGQLHPELQYYMALLLEQMPSDPHSQERPGGKSPPRPTGQAQPQGQPGLAREDHPSLWETLRPHGPQRAPPHRRRAEDQGAARQSQLRAADPGAAEPPRSAQLGARGASCLPGRWPRSPACCGCTRPRAAWPPPPRSCSPTCAPATAAGPT
ncbi:unnamed protein product [Eretmochelys imbricata]